MFHCLVIKVVLLPALCDSLFRLSHPENLVKNFFSKVFQIFPGCCAAVIFLSVSATRLLYHKFSRLSTVNLNFLKTNLFFSISEAISCDSLFILPLPQGEVKHFFQILSNLFSKTFILFSPFFVRAHSKDYFPLFYEISFIFLHCFNSSRSYADADTFPWLQGRHVCAVLIYSNLGLHVPVLPM